jgi:hypothetical protein
LLGLEIKESNFNARISTFFVRRLNVQESQGVDRFWEGLKSL